MTATCGQTVLIVDIRFVMNSFAVLLTLYREDSICPCGDARIHWLST